MTDKTGPTPGPWRYGKYDDSIVCDLEYYSGHLICESVCARDMPYIRAVPQMWEVLTAIETALALPCVNSGDVLARGSPIEQALRKVLADVRGGS